MSIADILAIVVARYMWGTIAVAELPRPFIELCFSISTDLDRGPCALRNMTEDRLWNHLSQG